MRVNWNNAGTIDSRTYVCGYCGNSVASEKGFHGIPSPGLTTPKIYICHYCGSPTYFSSLGIQTPGPIYGDLVNNLPNSNLQQLYDEARRCMGVSAYTAAVLSCRKLLMNIAVSKGAKEGLRFEEYVDHLVNNHFVPPGSKDWVDHIRNKGNEATHEIALMKKDDAEELVSFIAIILKMIFEFPESMRKKIPKKES